MARQGLASPPRRALGRDGLRATVRHLGYVQVDSIATVERAHHHILFSRNQTYRPDDLRHLIESSRCLFENWTHDAAIIPSHFFPYWRHRFAREEARLRERWIERFADGSAERQIEQVLERIASEGPLRARDFEGHDKPSTGWWDWHSAKTALEYLWRTGRLAVARREGFQKVYDLVENVIPAEHFSARVEHDAFVDWACREALRRLGFATRGEIAAFWDLLSPAEVEDWLARNDSDLISLSVEVANGGKPRICHALAGEFDPHEPAPEPPRRVRIMSPFDPLLRDRARAERLFGFYYRIEIFVPEARRRYGYYVFPVMRGDAVIGRIDMKAERECDRLFVRAFWPEQGQRRSAGLLRELEAEIGRVARLANVDRIEFADDWLRE
jgi:uncharacterized protein